MQFIKLVDGLKSNANGFEYKIGEVNEVCNHYLKDAEKATKEQLKDIRFR